MIESGWEVTSDVMCYVKWTTFTPESNSQASGVLMAGALKGFNGAKVTSNLLPPP